MTKQGLLQNVRLVFDTTIEDILLSKDCEVTKRGEGGPRLRASLDPKLPRSLTWSHFYLCHFGNAPSESKRLEPQTASSPKPRRCDRETRSHATLQSVVSVFC